MEGAMYKCLVYLFCSVFILSCDILRESPFEISAWSPGDGFHDPFDGAPLSVRFNRKPDKESVEMSFELLENGIRINGRAAWEDDIFYFYPSAPLRDNKEYSAVLSTGARDTRGIFLEKQFRGNWRTRRDEDHPQIENVFPDENGIMRRGFSPVSVTFSTAVPEKSCYIHISLTPEVEGSWHLDDSGKRALFTPISRWKSGENYILKVDSAFENLSGRTLGKDFIRHFSIDGDIEPPYLLGVKALNSQNKVVEIIGGENNEYILEEFPAENTGWESYFKLRFDFTENVETSSFKRALFFETALSFDLDTKAALADRIVVSFKEPPEYKKRYLIRLNRGIKDGTGNESTTDYIWQFFVNGAKSKPPELVRIEITTADFHETYTAGNNYQSIMLGNEKEAEIIMCFDTAQNAAVNLYSFMELFRFTATDNVLSFLTKTINDIGRGSDGLSRIVMEGTLDDRQIERGVVSIEIGAGLLDSLGNKQKAAQRIVLLK
jgi:hypothetical protein